MAVVKIAPKREGQRREKHERTARNSSGNRKHS